MGDLTLSTGKVVTLDLSKINFGEWRRYFRGIATIKEEDAFIEKITGIKPKDIDALPRNDYRRIMLAIIKEGNQPLDDPNSQSESTSA